MCPHVSPSYVKDAELRSARERNSDCRRIGNLNESAGASGSARPCVRPGSGAGSPTSDDESTTSTLTPLSSPEPETPGTSPYREVGSYGLRIQPVQSPTISRCFPDPKPEPYESSSGRQAGEPRPSDVSLGKRPERWQETSSSTWPAPRRRSTFPALNWRREYSVQQFTVDPRRERAIRSRNEKVVWPPPEGPRSRAYPSPRRQPTSPTSTSTSSRNKARSAGGCGCAWSHPPGS
ncbi:uncharacterized protein B0H18DRAFT_601819 [Fomitopsis serialis]|uniref:uncharacterized protein n=1 Tax=Fomitopsis serialis TaxID=139415 RepID=UPI002008C30E|nr:uncharacterized protein B0H18DRAFT_601819 [Neoantrodia serialis]KAH9933797.1 hypothetical protein B0H18DRAFT_601819 [Neoantrodia serialis]